MIILRAVLVLVALIPLAIGTLGVTALGGNVRDDVRSGDLGMAALGAFLLTLAIPAFLLMSASVLWAAWWL